ncbi:MAG: hypothetical protein R2783_08600 [Gelidibacter sp.]
MKPFVTIIAITLFTCISYGQQALDLKILRGADAPNSEPQQYYLFEVANNYNYDEEIQFTLEDANCADISPNNQVSFLRTLFNKTRTSQIQSMLSQRIPKKCFI